MGRNHYLTADDAEDKAGWIQHLTDACKITVSTFSVFHLSTCHDYRTHASLLPGKVMFLHLCVILFTGRSLSGGLCPGGLSVQVGVGSLSRCGVSVQGGGGLCQGDSPCTIQSGRYASYWNAFLLNMQMQKLTFYGYL